MTIADRASEYWLAIDTATATGSVALVAGDSRLIVERAADVHGTHASGLMVTVEAVLAEAGLTLSQLTGIAVSIGPGSFTGLRVGLSTAMGLGRAANLPLVPVDTLQAMAWAMPQPQGHLLAVALHARRGELYGAVYELGSEGGDLQLHTRVEVAAFTPDDFLATLHGLSCPVVVAGTGTPALAPDGPLRRAPSLTDVPRAAWVGALAAQAGVGAAVATGQLVPHYICESQAQRALAQKARADGNR